MVEREIATHAPKGQNRAQISPEQLIRFSRADQMRNSA